MVTICSNSEVVQQSAFLVGALRFEAHTLAHRTMCTPLYAILARRRQV